MREPFHKARLYITTLLVMEIILGATIMIVTSLYHYILGSFLADTERKMLSGQFFNTYLLGFQLIVTYVCSIYLWQTLWLKRCTPNVVLIISIWMFFCFLIVICGFGTIWSLFMCANAIENTTEMSLLKGIDLYYTCPEWKLLWDGMQFHKECCGVHDYKDWMNAAWMPAEALDEVATSCSSNKKTTLAPYACCKHTCNACFENYVPRSGNSGIPYLNMTQINCNGCLQQFSDYLWNVLYILLALVLIAFKIDFIICCLVKYILRRQKMNDIGHCNDGMGDEDCDPQPMVVVNCPPNVRCVVEEDDSACIPNDSNEDMNDPCRCLSQVTHGYAIKQHQGLFTVPTKTQSCKQSCSQHTPQHLGLFTVPTKTQLCKQSCSQPKKGCNKKQRFVH